ncbi:energy-coupling factor ABC transporter ATP-binding protein [candidate division LCP-89 bacterium B3_LCP]|uniref:Energy-coupling factor ABC transporter ATP-binding protein n=1 Tax=candidate division LCP-89 bacterium B3_LCP TaxID=2012998 RepID=A0A532V002_UNCL8|nr:MAG: energy-coupling factor ABC transporter ATP-binding protein [candidate division LCP-89 bacterium B3_LCP]
MDIRLEKVHFSYDDLTESREVLHDIGFSLKSGECVALVGASGSGKSTLAQHLNGLLKPDRGYIWIDGQRLRWTPPELRLLRKRVGLVFQFPEAQIFEATVFDEVAFASKQWGVDPEEIRETVERTLTDLGLDVGEIKNRNPLRLSGGEARLISIASLLVIDPDWIILDEPTLGLDFAHWLRVKNLILDRKAAAKGVILITHDLNLTLEVCPRTLILINGKFGYDGPTDELLINHDISAEYGLAPPEIIQIWKALNLSLNEETDIADLPGPDLTKLELWIKNQPLPRRQQLSSVLKQYISDLMI